MTSDLQQTTPCQVRWTEHKADSCSLAGGGRWHHCREDNRDHSGVHLCACGVVAQGIVIPGPTRTSEPPSLAVVVEDPPAVPRTTQQTLDTVLGFLALIAACELVIIGLLVAMLTQAAHR